MRDLTEGSITAHLYALAVPIAIGMGFQTAYFLVDLYFVAQLGDQVIAGVSAAGNVQFLLMALTQVLGVGSMALISHAVGRKDQAESNLIFNQSLLLALLCTLLTVVLGVFGARAYLSKVASDAAVVAAGLSYLYAYLPGLALQFVLVALGSALRGTGIAKPTMVVQMVTVLLNIVLAPMLIAGWGTGLALGAAGAGLASSIAIALGVLMMVMYFVRLERYVQFDRQLMAPQLAIWKRILRVGIPPGGEFALMFVYFAVIYWVLRPFGAEAQAGFGIGTRVMQAIFLPAMAVAFAVAPLAGQNVGAQRPDRVRQSFRAAAINGGAIMLILTLICQWFPQQLIAGFSGEPQVVAFGAEFLQIISWNFLLSGLVFTCSGMFQALGNTLPALLSSASRLLTFALPAILLSGWSEFSPRLLWMLSVASVAGQALISYWLLQRAMNRPQSTQGVKSSK